MGKNRHKKKRRKREEEEDGRRGGQLTGSSGFSGGRGDNGDAEHDATHSASLSVSLSAPAVMSVVAPLSSNLHQSTSAAAAAPPSGGGGGWSWSQAFAAASAVRPDESDLDADFLRRTAPPPPSSTGRGADGKGEGLAAIAEMAEAAASSPLGKEGGRTEEWQQQRQQQQQQNLPGKEATAVDSSAKEKKRKKKKRKKKEKKNKVTEEKCETRDRAGDERSGTGKSKKRRRRPSPDVDNAKGLSDDEHEVDDDDYDDDGTPRQQQQTPPSQQDLEGRMVSDPSSSEQVMVLVDSTSGTVYSGMDRTDSGDLIQVGRLVDGTVVLDSVQAVRGTEEEEGQSPRNLTSTCAEPTFPYPTEPDDHCESPPQSYEDIVPLLRQICNGLGGFEKKKASADLTIYDPYYCDGSVVQNLSSLGFPKVHNKKEDCYQVWSSPEKYPRYDAFITNPPYSNDHIERLMTHVTSAQVGTRPWFLLMPTWVHKKDYYARALDRAGCRPFYLVPRKRYIYIPPKNFRAKKASDVHKKSSPFVSMWYVWGGTAERTAALVDWYSRWSSKNADCRCYIARSRSALRDLRRKKK